MNNNTSSRKLDRRGDTAYLDLLNALSAVAVVYLHANYCFWSFNRDFRWISANVIESVCFFAVPVFFMISGATLVDYRDRYSTRVFFKKRLLKTGVPFLFWSLIALAFDLFVLHSVKASDLGWVFVASGILGTRFLNIYWFFIPLFCIYACMPLLSAVRKEIRLEAFGYCAALCFVVNSLVPFVLRFFPGASAAFPISIPIGANETVFVFLGYLLRYRKTSGWFAVVTYTLAVGGLAMILIGTHVRSLSCGSVDGLFKGHTNLPAVLYASGVFLFFARNGNQFLRSRYLASACRLLRDNSFGIYLVHWFVLTLAVMWLKRYPPFSQIEFSLWFRLFSPLAIIAACIAIRRIVNRIPFVGKYLLP